MHSQSPTAPSSLVEKAHATHLLHHSANLQLDSSLQAPFCNSLQAFSDVGGGCQMLHLQFHWYGREGQIPHMFA